MKYFYRTQQQDKKINKQIRSYGITKLAKILNVSVPLVSRWVNDIQVCSEKRYLQIKKIVKV